MSIPHYAPKVNGSSVWNIGGNDKTYHREIADVAFEQTIEIDAEWTDWAGRKHDKFIGRPVSMHAMRGISAHSNGFQTCRSIHILQILIGSIDVPGGFRYKPPFPKPAPPPLKPAGKVGEINANAPMPGPPLGFTEGRRPIGKSEWRANTN